MRLETDRLRLRELTAADLPRLLEWYADPAVTSFLGPGPWDEARAQRDLRAILRRYRQDGFGPWCVERKRDGVAVGTCGLQKSARTLDVELSYILGSEHCGRGYATEAARAAVEHGFRERGLRRIVAFTHPENEPSRAVLRRLGMRRMDLPGAEPPKEERWILDP